MTGRLWREAVGRGQPNYVHAQRRPKIGAHVKPYGFASYKRDLQLTCNALSSLGIKTRSFTANPLKCRSKRQTLNHRVPGSSPGAPTIRPSQTTPFLQAA
jgi:hypothetical protein